MRILVTASNSDPTSEVDARFGRAPHFMVYDTETGQFETHPNQQNLQAAQGAGIQAAQNADALKVDWILTGHCGPKAFQVLSAAGIQVAVEQKGTIREAVERCVAGQLQATASADVEGHWE